MTRIGKVLFAVLVLMLISSPAIGTSKKWIKIKVDENTGQIEDVKLQHTGGDRDSKKVDPPPSGTYVGHMIFHHSSPGCIVVVVGGYGYQVCW